MPFDAPCDPKNAINDGLTLPQLMNKKSTEKNVDLSMNIADFNSPTTSSQRKVDLQRKKKIIFNNNVKSVKAARVLYALKQLLFHLSSVQLVSLHVFFGCTFQFWKCRCNGSSTVFARRADFNQKYSENPRHCRRSDCGEVINSRNCDGWTVLGSYRPRSANANKFRDSNIDSISSHNVSQFVPRIKVRCINRHWSSSIPTVVSSAANGSRRQQWHNFLVNAVTQWITRNARRLQMHDSWFLNANSRRWNIQQKRPVRLCLRWWETKTVKKFNICRHEKKTRFLT